MSRVSVSLALQGGGAHGAFTWGVLDRLLEEPDLVIEGVSGTSAGAINACVLAQGLLRGGAVGAREALSTFWRRISEVGQAAFNPYQTTPLHALTRSWNLDWTPASMWLDVLAQFASPYQLNPLDHNPLRALLEEQLSFADLNGDGALRLFVAATNVKTNRLRVFANGELSVEALLASACLPQLHRAVAVEGEHYWDGGFLGNPVLKPLIRACSARDLVLVQLNPFRRAELPFSARDIVDRLNEVTMNAALMRELDMIATITRLVETGVIQDPRYVAIRFHRIADPEVMAGLGVRSKNNTALAFLTYLRDAGRATADRWLAANGSALGQRSTVDLDDFAIDDGATC
jgi:NTE family protein